MPRRKLARTSGAYTPRNRTVFRDETPQWVRKPASGKRKAGHKGEPGRPPKYRGVSGSGSTRARLPRNLSPESVQRVIRGYVVAKSACPAARRRLTIAAVADEAGVERHYPKRAFDKDKARGTVKRKPGSGRPRIHDKEDIEALHDYLKAESYCATYDELEGALKDEYGWCRETIRRYIKENCNEMWAAIKPKLSLAQRAKRLAFARADVRDSCEYKVHIDEKLFKSWKPKGKRKVPKGHAPPTDSVPSKTQVPGIMVIAVIARPRAGFDGKIMIRRVANRGVALRTSKNRKRGEAVWQDCSMTAEWFVKVATEEIIPAIRAAFERLDQRGCTVTANLDNARPHVGSGAIAKINEVGLGGSSQVKVKFELQSPNSPDFNVCDLCLFPSWGRRNDKLQKHAKFGDNYALWENVQRSWRDYPTDKIERAWQNRKLAMKEAIRLDGCNKFNIPHVSADVRARLLPAI